jgi:hypothetical protein
MITVINVLKILLALANITLSCGSLFLSEMDRKANAPHYYQSLGMSIFLLLNGILLLTGTLQ